MKCSGLGSSKTSSGIQRPIISASSGGLEVVRVVSQAGCAVVHNQHSIFWPSQCALRMLRSARTSQSRGDRYVGDGDEYGSTWLANSCFRSFMAAQFFWARGAFIINAQRRIRAGAQQGLVDMRTASCAATSHFNPGPEFPHRLAVLASDLASYQTLCRSHCADDAADHRLVRTIPW